MFSLNVLTALDAEIAVGGASRSNGRREVPGTAGEEVPTFQAIDPSTRRMTPEQLTRALQAQQRVALREAEGQRQMQETEAE